MTYSLEFVESALKEWRKLSPDIREQLRSKLREPREPARLFGTAARPAGLLQDQVARRGVRPVYQVNDK